jgi:carbamoyl-phosphate synthase large subunit
LTILFSCAGRRVDLLHCFRRSAQELDLPVRILAADISPETSPACRAADRFFRVSPCSSPEFPEELLRICKSERVDLLIPTIDPELEVLADHARRFGDEGAHIAVSKPSIVRMARNKLLTQRFLTKLGMRTPRTTLFEEFIDAPGTWNFPVIVKPISGSSSIGLYKVEAVSHLANLPKSLPGYIAQELHSGQEYTVNLFFDAANLRCTIPHRRLEVRGGEVSKGRTERAPALMNAAERLGTALEGEAFGAICFQAILSEAGEAIIFEVNARFGGGYPLAHHAGAHFAKWLIEIASGQVCSASNNWRENVLMLRYDAALFFEMYEQAPA